MTNTLQYAIAYESLLILETGEEVWYTDEQIIEAGPQQIQQAKELLKVLDDLKAEGKCREIKQIMREVSDWLI